MMTISGSVKLVMQQLGLGDWNPFKLVDGKIGALQFDTITITVPPDGCGIRVTTSWRGKDVAHLDSDIFRPGDTYRLAGLKGEVGVELQL